MQSPNLRFLWENKSLVKQHGFVLTDSGVLSAEIGCGAGPSVDAGLPGLCLLALGGVLSPLASQGPCWWGSSLSPSQRPAGHHAGPPAIAVRTSRQLGGRGFKLIDVA